MRRHIFLITVGLVLLVTVSAMYAADGKKVKPVGGGKSATAIQNVAGSQVEKAEIGEAVNQTAPINTATGEEINWQVISSGGDIDGSSTNFQLSGTVGQTAVGVGSSTNFGLGHGFWQESEGVVPCDCIPGDANNDGQVNVGDAVYLIAYIFKGGPPPVPYPICNGDANCDCTVNVGDAVYIISYVFKGGAAPCECPLWLINCGPPLRK